MKYSHHMFLRYVLALSLLLLPLQNTWAMADMTACDATMMSEKTAPDQLSTASMDMQNCLHHEDMLVDMNGKSAQTTDQDCCDTQCANCSHAAFLLPLNLSVQNSKNILPVILFKNNLLDFLPYSDSPPPIIS